MTSLDKIKLLSILGIKGMAMGAANVIPGVSGGTIALITGIFEDLIDALKSINTEAFRLFFSGKWKSFAKHIRLDFLSAVFAGVIISIFSIAKLLEYLFENHPVLVWAFFFGLIVASVYFVGRTIEKWKSPVVILFIVGAGIAVAISLFKPAQENDNFYYLIICGVVAVCSMILPGLSGSFVLILMGNYQLVMEGVSDLNWQILLPVGLGAIAGLVAFSHILSRIFKKYKDQTIGLLTGFMAGSLFILWPWKNPVFSMNSMGENMLNRSGDPIIESYTYLLPDIHQFEFWIAVFCIISGIFTIALIEKQGSISKSE